MKKQREEKFATDKVYIRATSRFLKKNPTRKKENFIRHVMRKPRP